MCDITFIYVTPTEGYVLSIQNKIQTNTQLKEWFDLSVYRLSVVRSLDGPVKQRRSKAIDMRFYWLKDRVSQKMFDVHWAPGKVNLADYYTKHHPAKHVKQIRSIYINGPNSPRSLQGCVKLLA